MGQRSVDVRARSHHRRPQHSHNRMATSPANTTKRAPTTPSVEKWMSHADNRADVDLVAHMRRSTMIHVQVTMAKMAAATTGGRTSWYVASGRTDPLEDMEVPGAVTLDGWSGLVVSG
jgi:hypothetical protein